MQNRPLLAFIPLAYAVILTLRDQMFWEASDIKEVMQLLVLWLVLIIGWLIRLVSNGLKKKSPTARDAVLPLALLFAFICGKTHLPLRALFFSHKGALAQALKRPPQSRSGSGASIGFLIPLQISKSGGSTRILFWESGFVASGTVVGFAHCPHNNGCKASSFAPYFVEDESVGRTIPIYKDWVAVSVDGTDF